GETVHDKHTQGLAADVEESRGAVLRALRTSAYVCDPTKRGRRCRSHGDSDVAAKRCGSVQALQPGEARHDARGAYKTRSSGERTEHFQHIDPQLIHFRHIFKHTSARFARSRM